MEKTNVDSLLEGLAALVSDARGSLFGQDKCMVDKDQLLYLVDALQTQIPQELSQSKAVIESCNELRTNAKKDAAKTRKQADQILQDAEERAAKLIEESQIVQLAKLRAQEIMDHAQQQSDELVSGALGYADRIMADAEKSVTETYDTLRAGISALQAKGKEDKTTALAKVKEARKALKNAAKTEQNKK